MNCPAPFSCHVICLLMEESAQNNLYSGNGNMDPQKLRSVVKSCFSVLTLVLVFSSVFLIRCDPIDNSFDATVTVYVVNFVVLVIISCFSYYRRINLRVLYLILFILVISNVLLASNATGTVLTASNILTGSICGVSLLLYAGILSFSSPKSIRREILLGVAGATLVMPLFHTFTDFDGVLIRQILFVLVLATMFVLLIVVDRSKMSLPAAKEVFRKYGKKGKRLSEFIFSQRRSNLITLIMIIPFFFCQGVFGDISFEKGFSYSSSDIIMVGTCAVIFVLYIADRIKRTNAWFNTICFAVGAMYMTIIFSTLIIADYPPAVYGVMRAGLVVMQIWLLIMLSEIASEQSISPIFLYGVLAPVYLLPNIAGYSMAASIGDSAANGPILVSGAMMAIAVAAGVIVVLVMRSKSFTSDKPIKPLTAETVILTPEHGAAQFEEFCRKNGLSEKESEVILLYSQGRSVRSISTKMFLAESTVRTYIQRTYSKLDIHSRQELLDALDQSMQVDEKK